MILPSSSKVSSFWEDRPDFLPLRQALSLLLGTKTLSICFETGFSTLFLTFQRPLPFHPFQSPQRLYLGAWEPSQNTRLLSYTLIALCLSVSSRVGELSEQKQPKHSVSTSLCGNRDVYWRWQRKLRS